MLSLRKHTHISAGTSNVLLQKPRRGSRRVRGFDLTMPEYLKHSPQDNVRIIHRLTRRPLGGGSEHFKAQAFVKSHCDIIRRTGVNP